jgi:hypothetical protein
MHGVFTGLLRIGWEIPLHNIGGNHGAMMVGGFLGALICLESATLLKRKWAYLVPSFSGISVVAFLLGYENIGHLLLIVASIGLIIIQVGITTILKKPYLEFLIVGAFCWLAGNILLFQNQFYPTVFPWWMLFILFTVVGKRLEFSRFLPLENWQKYLLIFLLLITLVGFMMPYHGTGRLFSGFGMVTVAIWMIKYDLSSLLVKKEGNYFYSGLALTIGYLWLIVSGFFFVFADTGPFGFDLVIHTFFLGFTFSILFAQSPITFPSILQRVIGPYRRVLYFCLGLLHLSLILRIVADILLWPEVRKWSGMFNGIAIILFLITLLILVQKERNLPAKLKE